MLNSLLGDCDNIGKNVVLIGALLAISIAQDLNVNEQDLVGNILQVTAQNLLSMAAVVNDCDALTSNENDDENNNE